MKNSALAVLAFPFLLLIGQAASAQSYGWQVETDVDVIDDSVRVTLIKRANPDFESSLLFIFCDERAGFPMVYVTMFAAGDLIKFPTGLVEVVYRIGTDEAVTHEWEGVVGGTSLRYLIPYIDDGSAYAGTDNATALLAAMVQNNSRFIVRAESNTRIWNIEGLADVIDECMAVFD